MSDVKTFAGESTGPMKSLSFQQQDEIKIDHSKRVYTSKGKTVLEIMTKKDKEEDSLDTSHDLPQLGATTVYQLELIHCHKAVKRQKRNIPSSTLHSSHDSVTDSLLARRDEGKWCNDNSVTII